MELLATMLVWIGLALALIGLVKFTLATFRQSRVWGLTCFFVPIAGVPLFLIFHWHQGKVPFLIQWSGIVLMVLGTLLMPQQL